MLVLYYIIVILNNSKTEPFEPLRYYSLNSSLIRLNILFVTAYKRFFVGKAGCSFTVIGQATGFCFFKEVLVGKPETHIKEVLAGNNGVL